MTGAFWRSAGKDLVRPLVARGVAVIPGVVLALALAACASAAVAQPAAGDAAPASAPGHGSFSCRGTAARHGGPRAYVAGRAALTPVDLVTGKPGRPLLSADDPIAIAISADGRTAYAGTPYSVVPINVATNAVGKPIAVPAGAENIAIAPDGRIAYAAGDGGITPIFLSTCATGRVIAIPSGLELVTLIAVTPDGRTAYLAGNLESNNDGQPGGGPGILRVDLVHGIAGRFLPTSGFYAAAVAPNGQMAYLSAGKAVIPVSLVTGKAGKPISIPGAFTGPMVITANGRTGYVGGLKPLTPGGGEVIPVNLTTGTAEAPIHVPSYPFSIEDIVISANGRAAYATDLTSLVPVQLASRTAGKPITLPDGGYNLAVTG
jgi:hypothetical protein